MIHYHGLPMTPTDAMIRVMSTRHCMVSYAHPEQVDVAAEICQSVALDNGAFSAWASGQSFDFAGYAEWAALWTRHPAIDWCLIPDVIDGSEADNNAMINDWPLSPHVSVPVWHLHESLARLQWLCSTFPRIALGSSGQWATPGTREWWKRMSSAMDIACDSDGVPRCKLHGLRMLDSTIFSHLPLSSADSTNVARNVGIDKRWIGPYTPKSRDMRAAVLIERIESHASARRWVPENAGVFANYELLA